LYSHLKKKEKPRIKTIFGEVAAKIQAIESEKRDLPDVHILVVLSKKWKIKDRDQFVNMNVLKFLH